MPHVMLTFDAEFPDQSTWSRNDPQTDTDKIVSALTQYNIPATFFVQGRWAQACPRAVERIVTSGFTVASHGFYHAPYRLLTAAGARQDVTQAHEVLAHVTGVEPTLFRYPYGGVAHKSTVQSLGYEAVGWDFAPEDWNLTDWRVLVERMREAEGVVLLHTWTATVGSHLKQYLIDAMDRGVTFGELKGAS